MTSPMLSLTQTLHGYDQGHRLLSEGGQLDDRERALLERLSDLSGYLPTGASFERYHTGFPCGRYYAFACTWPDPSAVRAGTVLTHTLLISRGEARTLQDLWALASLHRLPRDPSDRDAYRAPLTLSPPPPSTEAHLSPHEAAATTALLFGTVDRPILWVDERPADSAIRRLWSLLPPEQRERFAFCTFALQHRTVEGRPFDFLGLPPTARGSFLDKASSEAWWDSGRLLHPKVAGMLQQPWVQAIAQRDVVELRRLEEACGAVGLPAPRLQDVPLVWRWTELESAATQRLAAARARADLLERIWPGLDPAHPAAGQVLQTLLDRLPDAVLEPRPLWELTDFLKRPLVQRRQRADADFEARVEAVRAHELGRRFAQAPVQTLQGLQELIEASGSPWSEQGLEVLRRVVASTPDAASRLAPPLLLAATDMGHPGFAHVGLGPLDSRERRHALEAALHREEERSRSTASSRRDLLLRLAEETSTQLGDLELLQYVFKLRGDTLGGLRVASQLALTRGEMTRIEECLVPLLAEADAPTRLAWALETVDERLVWLAAKEGVRAAQQEALTPDELVRRCSTAPNGIRTLLAFASDMKHVEPLTQALRRTPSMALELVAQSLKDQGVPVRTELTHVAAEVLPSEQLLSPELLEALRTTQDLRRAGDLLWRVGPAWVREACRAHSNPRELAEWLSLPSLRQWLRDSSRWQLFSIVDAEDRSHCLAGFAAVLRTWLEAGNNRDLEWTSQLVDKLLRDATKRELDESSLELGPLMKRLLSTTWDEYLASRLLDTVMRTKPATGWRLVEVAFPQIYARVVREDPFFIRFITTRMTGKDWDRAKPLRHWLLDAYMDFGWPADSFLRCMGEDTALFRRIVHRAAKSSEGMAFIRLLPSAFDAAPELARFWSYPVEQALAEPHRPVDYE